MCLHTAPFLLMFFSMANSLPIFSLPKIPRMLVLSMFSADHSSAWALALSVWLLRWIAAFCTTSHVVITKPSDALTKPAWTQVCKCQCWLTYHGWQCMHWLTNQRKQWMGPHLSLRNTSRHKCRSLFPPPATEVFTCKIILERLPNIFKPLGIRCKSQRSQP